MIHTVLVLPNVLTIWLCTEQKQESSQSTTNCSKPKSIEYLNMQALTKFNLGDLVLKNRIVLAPLTRARYVSAVIVHV